MNARTEVLPMRQQELHRYHTLHLVREHRLTGAEAAQSLGLSLRHVRRLLARLRQEGRRAVVHGNRGRPSPPPARGHAAADPHGGPREVRGLQHHAAHRAAPGRRPRGQPGHRPPRAPRGRGSPPAAAPPTPAPGPAGAECPGRPARPVGREPPCLVGGSSPYPRRGRKPPRAGDARAHRPSRRPDSTAGRAPPTRHGGSVPQDELAGLGLRSAGPVPGWAAPPRAGYPGRAEHAVDGDPADREARGLELLGELRGVEARVLPSGPAEDLLPRGLGQAASRRPAPVPVDHGSAALLSEPGEEPSDVPEAQAETLGRLGAGEPVLADEVQGMVAMQPLLAHRQDPWCVRSEPSLPGESRLPQGSEGDRITEQLTGDRITELPHR